MALKAFDVTLQRKVTSKDVRQNGWYTHTFICPHCKQQLIFVNSFKRTPHFRHRTQVDHYWEPETEQHELMKVAVYEWLKKKGWDVDYEVRVGSNVADVVAEKNGIKIAVEVQYSNADSKRVWAKTVEYTKNGYYTMWLLHSRFLNKYWKKWFVIRSAFVRMTLFWNDAHVYFLDPTNNQLGKYKLRKKAPKPVRVPLGGWAMVETRLKGYRYRIHEKMWAPLDEYDVVWYFKEEDGLLIARPILNKPVHDKKLAKAFEGGRVVPLSKAVEEWLSRARMALDYGVEDYDVVHDLSGAGWGLVNKLRWRAKHLRGLAKQGGRFAGEFEAVARELETLAGEIESRIYELWGADLTRMTHGGGG